MNARSLVWLLPLALWLAGCGNTTATTDVRSDGSFSRTVKLVVPESSLVQQLTPEKLFALPMGSPWKAERTRDKDRNIVFTARREVSAGQALAGDVTILKLGKPFLSNGVRVVRRDDGLLEYREKITFLGTEKPDLEKGAQDLGNAIRASLPSGVASQAEAERIGIGVVRELWRSLFGPGDPLFGHLLAHPGLLEKRFRQRVGASADRIVKEVLGSRLSEAQRHDFVRKLVLSDRFDDKGLFDPRKEADKQDQNSGGSPEFVSMLFVAKLPGKVVSTNGEYDPIADEVVWAMYPMAAQLGPVELVAVCRP